MPIFGKHEFHMYLTTSTTEKSRHLALFDEIGVFRSILRELPETLICEPVVFESPEESMAALSRMNPYEVFLLATENELLRKCLCGMCKLLHIPVLFLAGERWKLDPAEKELGWNDVVYLHGRRKEELAIEIAGKASMLRARRSFEQCEINVHGKLDKGMYVWENYEFISVSREVICHGRRVLLQPKQFYLALTLFQNIGKLLERDWLLELLWSTERVNLRGRALDVCVANIRRKLDLKPATGYVIQAIYGKGYILVKSDPMIAAEALPLTAFPASRPANDDGVRAIGSSMSFGRAG